MADRRWKAVRRAVRRRDGWCCRRCGAPKKGKRSLHVHHLRGRRECPASEYDPDNLVTLCRACHAWVHSGANTLREWLTDA